MQIASFLLSMALLQSGGKLEIKDLKVGTGPAAQSNDFLTMDYTGKLSNGTVFDSSTKPGRTPFQFLLGAGQVIKGWDQGIVGMKVGGKRTLVIPPGLAYGAHPQPGGPIPPNATLTFYVVLKAIHKCEANITKEGAGPSVKIGDTVQIQYTLSVKGGAKIDSSLDHPDKKPVALPVGQPGTLPAFTQALVGMKAGEKKTVTILPEFGFGAQARAKIPANSTLLFDIELVKIGK